MSDQIEFNQPDVTQDDKLWSALGYPVPLIALIMLLMEEKKVRPFIKYHSIQSLALNLVLWVVMLIASVTVVGVFCLPVLWLVTLWPAIDAYKGNYMELPVLTNFLKSQNWIS